MNEDLNFKYSKEGFVSRLTSLKDVYETGAIVLEEYQGFRESELNEIVSRNQTDGMSLISIVLSVIACLSFYGIGFFTSQSMFYYTGTIALAFFVYNFITSNKNKKDIAIGNRQEILDYLLNLELISIEEFDDLNQKIINKMSN